MLVDSFRPERGNTTVLSLGFLAIVGLLVVVFVNVSAVFLEHGRLVNTVDAAALRAADALDEAQYYRSSELTSVSLDPARASAAARAGVPADVRLTVTVHDDTVVVRGERNVNFRLLPPGLASGTQIVATAAAILYVPDQRP